MSSFSFPCVHASSFRTSLPPAHPPSPFAPLPVRRPLSSACCCCHWFLPTIGLFVVASHVNCMYNIDGHANANAKGGGRRGRGWGKGTGEASVDANADANADWKC